MTQQPTPKKLSLYVKNSYALADVTFILMVTLTNTYAQIFLTDYHAGPDVFYDLRRQSYFSAVFWMRSACR